MELSINNVTKQFKVKKAVDDISFSMKNGVYGLLGVNGAAAALQQPADDPQPERVGQGLQQLRLLLIEGGGIAHVAHLIVIF